MNRFPRVMAVRLGYDPEQVDELVRRIERTLGVAPLDGPPVTADEIRNAKFGVRLGGYNETAVDFALDAFIVAVEARAGSNAAAPLVSEGSASEGSASGGSASSASPPGVAAPRVPASGGSAPAVPALREPASRVSAAVSGSPAPPADPAAASARTATREDRSAQAGPAQAGAVPAGPSPAPGPDDGTRSWRESQAERAERVAFRPGRLGMGYREDEVDAFLDRVVATLRGTAAEPLTADQVRKATFATVVFRPGYAIGEVDGFLAEMASVLERCP